MNILVVDGLPKPEFLKTIGSEESWVIHLMGGLEFPSGAYPNAVILNHSFRLTAGETDRDAGLMNIGDFIASISDEDRPYFFLEGHPEVVRLRNELTKYYSSTSVINYGF